MLHHNKNKKLVIKLPEDGPINIRQFRVIRVKTRVEYYIGVRFVVSQKRRHFYTVILKYWDRK